MPGRHYEELEPGTVLVHQPSRTVTETDNLLFSTLTMNPQPLHLDAEFARRSIHGRILVNGLFTLSLMMGLTVADTTLGTTAGNLGFEAIGFPKPVFIGDTITAETEVVARRVSESRPAYGIVEFEHRARNQRGEVVVSCRRSGLVTRREFHAGERA
ncbi:MAG TPA: MaoC family dehydratase [Solirubrobacteraceae bacterium]|nr:MaoC family dehydratase [Solirubrobacteraceae bacterium]